MCDAGFLAGVRAVAGLTAAWAFLLLLLGTAAAGGPLWAVFYPDSLDDELAMEATVTLHGARRDGLPLSCVVAAGDAEALQAEVVAVCAADGNAR